MLTGLTGCGDDAPDFVEVKGKVYLDDNLLKAGSISFIPDTTAGNSGPQSTSKIADTGVFELFGPGTKKGAVLGKHKVLLKCPFDASGGSSGSGDPNAPQAAKCVIPKKFETFESTTLSFEVKAEGHKDIELKFSSK